MFGRIFLTALAAGVLSGIFIWGAHSIKTTPLILAAEAYENQGEAVGDGILSRFARSTTATRSASRVTGDAPSSAPSGELLIG